MREVIAQLVGALEAAKELAGYVEASKAHFDKLNAALAAGRAALEAQAVPAARALPYFNRREVEYQIEITKQPPAGTLLFNDSKERITLPGGTLERMLSIIDMLAAAPQPQQPDPRADPGEDALTLAYMAGRSKANAEQSQPSLQAAEHAGLEQALETLVNRCNAEFGIASDPAVIAAEAALERLYRWRTGATMNAKKQPAPQAEDARDAARYRWLEPRLLAADFCYGDECHQVLVFKMPDGFCASADLGETLDAARALGEKGE
jgi:hypothetical protein